MIVLSRQFTAEEQKRFRMRCTYREIASDIGHSLERRVSVIMEKNRDKWPVWLYAFTWESGNRAQDRKGIDFVAQIEDSEPLLINLKSSTWGERKAVVDFKRSRLPIKFLIVDIQILKTDEAIFGHIIDWLRKTANIQE